MISPVAEPRLVLLSEGPGAAAWWEHSVLARELCAPVVTAADLEVRDGRVIAWLDGRPRAVDVVYQRTDDDRFSGTALELLIEPAARGTVAVVNAPGAVTSMPMRAAASAVSKATLIHRLDKARSIISPLSAGSPLRGECPESGSLEGRRTLLHEGHDALLEVIRAR